MKKLNWIILVACLLLLPAVAFAASQTVISTPADDVYGVMVMDDNGNCVSQVVSSTNYGSIIDWTVTLTRVNSNTGHIFTKNGAGNWIDSGRTVDLSGFSGASEPSVSYSAPSTPSYSATPWPMSPYVGMKATLKNDSSARVQTRCGPAGDYAGAGAFVKAKITRLHAYFIEGNYVYVELRSKTVAPRRLYIAKKFFYEIHKLDVPKVSLTGYDAVLTSSVTARFGPGIEFDVFKEAELSGGLSISVFYEENGWVYAEFPCAAGYVRGWIPADCVAAN